MRRPNPNPNPNPNPTPDQERFATEKEYEAVRGAYVVDAKLMTQAKRCAP